MDKDDRACRDDMIVEFTEASFDDKVGHGPEYEEAGGHGEGHVLGRQGQTDRSDDGTTGDCDGCADGCGSEVDSSTDDETVTAAADAHNRQDSQSDETNGTEHVEVVDHGGGPVLADRDRYDDGTKGDGDGFEDV